MSKRMVLSFLWFDCIQLIYYAKILAFYHDKIYNGKNNRRMEEQYDSFI